MSDKKYTAREAAIAVLKKAEELYSLSKARVDEGKDKYNKAYDRAERNQRSGTTTITREPSTISKILGKKPTVEIDTRHGSAGSRRGSAYMPGSAPSTKEGVTIERKVVGTPAKTPDYPKSSFKHSNAVGKSEESPMKGHIKLAKFMGRMEAKREDMAKGEDPLSPIAGNRMKRAAGYKESGDKFSHKIAVEGAKESHQGRLKDIKAAPKPKLPG